MLWEYCKTLKTSNLIKSSIYKVGISSYSSLQSLLYFSPRNIDLIPDAGDIESNNDYEESFSDQFEKDGLEDKIVVVCVSCLLKLAKINIPFTCQSCKTEISIKTLKRGSAIIFMCVSEEF